MDIYVAQTVAMVAMTICYFPQIKQLYITKKADDMNVFFWRILTLGLLANVYISMKTGLAGGGWVMFVVQVMNTLLSTVTWVLVEIYQREEGLDDINE